MRNSLAQDLHDHAHETLTGQQRMMLRMISRGYDVEEVAGALSFSVGWTYEELRTVRETLDVPTNAAAVVEGLRLGIIGLPELDEMWRGR